MLSMSESQQMVYDMLKELGGKATVKQLLELAKKKNYNTLRDSSKIRDRLILLSKKGVVKSNGNDWLLTK